MPVTQDGTIYAFDSFPGVGPQDILTQAGFAGIDDTPGAATVVQTVQKQAQAAGGVTPKVNYLWYFLGIFVLLVGMKYAGHKASGAQPQLAGVGVYNFVVIGVMAMLFILTGKVIFNKYPIKGVTDLFNAV